MATLYFGNTLINQSEANVATVVESLTKAEYEALAVKDPNTLYVLTDVAGDNPVFMVESWVTTNAEIEAAYQSGKLVVCVDAGMPFHLVFRRSATEHWFANVDSEYYCTYSVINDEWEFYESMYAPRDHANIHKTGGRDPITPEMIGAAPAYTWGTEDLEEGVSPLETGKLYFVIEG